MKSRISAALLLTAALLFSACDDEKATQPVGAISLDKTQLEVNESMTLHFVGQADNVVVYPGDEDHDYELRSESNTGLVVNKNLLTYSYSTPGVYKVVCVATNHADEGQSILTDTCSTYVRVIDDCTEIEGLSTTALYDEVFATELNTSDWLLAMPRKIKYKNANPSVSLSQKLKFYIPSTTTVVYIDGEEFDSDKKYNLGMSHAVRLVSHEGSAKDYKLYTLNYGEFKTFKAAGVSAAVVRTEYDYSYFEINMELPAGTDLTSVAPEFTMNSDNEKVYIGNLLQTPGTPVDFSSPVTYRIVVTSEENPSITLESVCVVTMTCR